MQQYTWLLIQRAMVLNQIIVKKKTFYFDLISLKMFFIKKFILGFCLNINIFALNNLIFFFNNIIIKKINYYLK